MKSTNNIFKLSRSRWISIAVLASSLGIAAAAVPLTTFTPGTTISASAVNSNFSALNNALPLAWASSDSVVGGVTVSATSAPQTISSISIAVPAEGHLIVAGTVFVNNRNPSTVLYSMGALLDGLPVNNGFGAAAALAASGTGGVDIGTLSYTVTTPVTAGTHTISQDLFSLDSNTALPLVATYFYNRQNLTVIFVPAISGFTASLIAPSGASTSQAAPSGVSTPQADYGF